MSDSLKEMLSMATERGFKRDIQASLLHELYKPFLGYSKKIGGGFTIGETVAATLDYRPNMSQIVDMPPQTFFAAVNTPDPRPPFDLTSFFNEPETGRLKTSFSRGEGTTLPFLNIEPFEDFTELENRSVKKVIGHEGRHRAAVAHKLGFKSIPVYLMQNTEYAVDKLGQDILGKDLPIPKQVRPQLGNDPMDFSTVKPSKEGNKILHNLYLYLQENIDNKPLIRKAFKGFMRVAPEFARFFPSYLATLGNLDLASEIVDEYVSIQERKLDIQKQESKR